jgi:hypothetical protein
MCVCVCVCVTFSLSIHQFLAPRLIPILSTAAINMDVQVPQLYVDCIPSTICSGVVQHIVVQHMVVLSLEFKELPY